MITVETIINAPLDKVWECWTKPDHITQWNFASNDWCCPWATNDLRPEGKLNWRMEAKDGSIGFDFVGTYKQIVEKASISYVIEDGRKVDIRFSKDGNTVKLTERFEPEKINSEALQKSGWQAILENFKNYVESKTS